MWSSSMHSLDWVQVEVLLGFLGHYLISRSSSREEGGYQDEQGGAGDNQNQQQGGDGWHHDDQCEALGKHSQKKAEFYEKISQTGGRGQPDFISLIQKYICTRNTVKFLNKDFIKAVRGGGVTVLWNFFIKFRFFLKDGFPKRETFFLYPPYHCAALSQNVT